VEERDYVRHGVRERWGDRMWEEGKEVVRRLAPSGQFVSLILGLQSARSGRGGRADSH
jgi:hypothetical protein